DVFSRGLGRKRIHSSRAAEGIGGEAGVRGHAARTPRTRSIGTVVEERICEPEKGRLSVELQIIFAFQHIIEEPYSSTEAGFSRACRVPCKPDPGRPVVLIAEVGTLGSSRIAGEYQGCRRVYETTRVGAGNDAERTSLGIEFGLAIFVAKSQCQHQVSQGMPF